MKDSAFDVRLGNRTLGSLPNNRLTAIVSRPNVNSLTYLASYARHIPAGHHCTSLARTNDNSEPRTQILGLLSLAAPETDGRSGELSTLSPSDYESPFRRNGNGRKNDGKETKMCISEVAREPCKSITHRLSAGL